MLLCGALVGALQGFFVAYEGIPAFIVTLAGLQRDPRPRPPDDGRLFDPHPLDPGLRRPRPSLGARHAAAGILMAGAILVIGLVLFNETPFGRYVTGGSAPMPRRCAAPASTRAA